MQRLLFLLRIVLSSRCKNFFQDKPERLHFINYQILLGRMRTAGSRCVTYRVHIRNGTYDHSYLDTAMYTLQFGVVSAHAQMRLSEFLQKCRVRPFRPSGISIQLYQLHVQQLCQPRHLSIQSIHIGIIGRTDMVAKTQFAVAKDDRLQCPGSDRNGRIIFVFSAIIEIIPRGARPLHLPLYSNIKAD